MSIDTLRARLSKLSAASLRLNHSLDLDLMPDEVVQGAQVLTEARYGILASDDEDGQLQDLRSSGLTSAERQALLDNPERRELFGLLWRMREPLRVADLHGHVGALGLPALRASVPERAFLMTPIRHLNQGLGCICLGNAEADRVVSQEDEETVVLFASQAALVIDTASQSQPRTPGGGGGGGGGPPPVPVPSASGASSGA